MNGVIFDVKRFAVHDGNGLRTTLFLKGCPLHCPWCQNPEGLGLHRLVWNHPSRCLHCGGCVEACPKGALALTDRICVDSARCTACGKCVEVCPSEAMRLCGETISSQQAVALLLRDRAFFHNGGGVTLSGGEVLLQWQFAEEVLTMCHSAGIDTAIETALYAERSAIDALLPVVDHFFVDIKLLSRQAHKAIIGVDNQPILSHYRYLVAQGADVVVRTPLIPGFTATEENIRAIADFIYRVDPNAKYELLNFNPLCRSKYEALQQTYPIGGAPFTEAEMERYYEIIRQSGLRIYKEE